MIANIFVVLISLVHFYFLILEMFLWTTPKGLRAFGQSLEQAKASAKLAANQGLYNGFLSAGLLWGVLERSAEHAQDIKTFFLSCVAIAGLYGAASVSRKLFFVQALPALMALVFILFGI